MWYRPMQVQVFNNNIDQALKVLKRKARKDPLDAALRLRAIPKPSERRREKERRATSRRLKKARRLTAYREKH